MYKITFLSFILLNLSINGNPAIQHNPPLYTKIQAALTLEPLLHEAANWLTNDQQAIYLPDASESATKFVRLFAKELSFANYEQLQVKIGDGYAATNSFIIIEKLSPEFPYYSKIDYAFILLERASTPEAIEYAHLYLDMQMGILEHEFAHITKKHCRNAGIMLGLIATTSFIGSQVLEYKFLGNYIKNSSLFKKISYGITSGSVLLLINRLAWHFIVRKQEYDADEATRNNSTILFAMATYFYNAHEELREVVKNKRGEKYLAFFDKYPFLYQVFDFHHPTHLARAQRFEQRYKETILTESLQSSNAI